ncbi:MAG: hypothetical protein PUJ07_05265, partial [Eubacteriales bacterium]|nr:hypothetical protein [Eubacteriales bacterium]
PHKNIKYFELNARSLVNARFACSNFIVIKSITCGAAFPLPKKFRVKPSFFGSPMSFCLSSLPLPDGNVNILYFLIWILSIVGAGVLDRP